MIAFGVGFLIHENHSFEEIKKYSIPQLLLFQDLILKRRDMEIKAQQSVEEKGGVSRGKKQAWKSFRERGLQKQGQRLTRR